LSPEAVAACAVIAGCYTLPMGELKTLMTAEQIPLAAATRRAELVRGEVIEMSPVGRPHGRIVLRLGSLLLAHVSPRNLGEAGTEVGFVLARNPDTVRAPDVSFVSTARLASAPADGFFPGAPDLAVEVLSPEDRASEIQEKTREYLAAGSRLVWIVDPQTETVIAYRPSGDARIYSGADEVSGEDVLPGFSFRPTDLFHLD